MKTIIAGLTIATLASSGCTRGSHDWHETANPQTQVTITPNMLAGTVTLDFFSNDGRAMTADRLFFKKDAMEFEATNLSITERSVENREANVGQITAIGATMEKALNGFANIAGQFIGIAAVMGHRSGSSGAPLSDLQGIIDAARSLQVQPKPLPFPPLPVPGEQNGGATDTPAAGGAESPPENE